MRVRFECMSVQISAYECVIACVSVRVCVSVLSVCVNYCACVSVSM